jgi:hypothetical protein
MVFEVRSAVARLQTTYARTSLDSGFFLLKRAPNRLEISVEFAWRWHQLMENLKQRKTIAGNSDSNHNDKVLSTMSSSVLKLSVG